MLRTLQEPGIMGNIRLGRNPKHRRENYFSWSLRAVEIAEGMARCQSKKPGISPPEELPGFDLRL
jgi:hypothetical protein